VEPGEIELWVGPSCAERETASSITIEGPVHAVRNDDERYVLTEVISRSARARVEQPETVAGA
jgi:beta-glucosidase